MINKYELIELLKIKRSENLNLLSIEVKLKRLKLGKRLEDVYPNISKSFMSKLENNKINVKVEDLYPICQAVKINEEDLKRLLNYQDYSNKIIQLLYYEDHNSLETILNMFKQDNNECSQLLFSLNYYLKNDNNNLHKVLLDLKPIVKLIDLNFFFLYLYLQLHLMRFTTNILNIYELILISLNYIEDKYLKGIYLKLKVKYELSFNFKLPSLTDILGYHLELGNLNYVNKISDFYTKKKIELKLMNDNHAHLSLTTNQLFSYLVHNDKLVEAKCYLDNTHDLDSLILYYFKTKNIVELTNIIMNSVEIDEVNLIIGNYYLYILQNRYSELLLFLENTAIPFFIRVNNIKRLLELRRVYLKYSRKNSEVQKLLKLSVKIDDALEQTISLVVK